MIPSISHVFQDLKITSILPCFILSALFFEISKLVLRYSKFYQKAVQKSSQSRYKTLDGLRGYLALGVFFHHALMNYYYFEKGYFGVELSRFYDFLGQAAVSFFFMITGFLFWSKSIERKSNLTRSDLKKFYIKRFFRIYPMYWFSLGLVIIVVLFISQFSPKSSFLNLTYELTRLTTLSSFVFINGSHGPTSINTISIVPINSSIQWTLVYEVQFYLLLPFLAIFSKPKSFLLFSTGLILLYFLYPVRHIAIIINFLWGMIAAYVVNQLKAREFKNRWLYGAIILSIFTTVIMNVTGDFLTSPIASFLLFIAFTLIAQGNSLFGLLTTSGARYLGTISYSIYLLHGIVLFLVFHTVDLIFPIKTINAWYFWLITGICGLVVIGVSGITYRLIEEPFLRIKQLAKPSID
jgi:peptidoglycan/LPS O-acetylase OafA/YrhL